MLDTFIDHADKVGVVIGLIIAIATGYMRWMPADRIEANHHALTRAVEWASRGSWLDTMQHAVRFILGLMDRIYGPANPADPGLRGFLTARAWKVSAWFASLLLFVVPAFATGCLGIHLSISGGKRGTIFTTFFLLGLSAIMILPFVHTWKKIQQNDAISRGSGVEFLGTALASIIREGVLFFGLLIPPIILMFLVAWVQRDSEPTSMSFFAAGLLFLCLMLIIIALAFHFIRAIRRHGFLAPLAFVGILIVTGSLGFTLFYLLLAFGSVDRTFLSIIFYFLPTPITLALIYFCARNPDSRPPNAFLLAYAGLVVALSLAGAIASDLTAANAPDSMMRFVLGIVLVGIAPYVLGLYAGVFANAFPDWLSIAVTRDILGRALRSKDIKHFLWFLLLDLLCVVVFCAMTTLIIVAAFASAAVIIEAAVSGLGLSFIWNSTAQFFWAGAQAPAIVADRFLLGNPNPIDTTGLVGLVVVGVMFTLGLTSLLPTLVNALIVSALLIARIVADGVGRPLAFIHSQLVISPDTTLEERSERRQRSAGLIGLMIVVLIGLIYITAWLVSPPEPTLPAPVAAAAQG